MLSIPMCGSGSFRASCHRQQPYRSSIQDREAVSGGKTGQNPGDYRRENSCAVAQSLRDDLHALRWLKEVWGFAVFWG
jgi:hypothetical protein